MPLVVPVDVIRHFQTRYVPESLPECVEIEGFVLSEDGGLRTPVEEPTFLLVLFCPIGNGQEQKV